MRGGDGGGEENGGEASSIPLLVGLWQRWRTRMRMTVVAGGTKQQPTHDGDDGGGGRQ